jgi:hypothetical protein
MYILRELVDVRISHPHVTKISKLEAHQTQSGLTLSQFWSQIRYPIKLLSNH